MAKDTYNNSHLSVGGKEGNESPVTQKHRNKMGENISNQKNPNGAECGPTNKMVGNSKVTY